MLETRFVESNDHTRIAYDVSGVGHALILLHGGFIQNRQMWHEAGYVERLNKHYTVIPIDFRGHGESDRPMTPEAYAPDRFMEDIKAIIDACHVSQFYLWGYSMGGTVGLQIASQMKETIGAILVGVWFGKLFTSEMTAMALSRIEAVEQARAEGIFHKLDLNPIEKDFFSKVDTSFLKNVYPALADFPPVEPEELLCPTLMVTGTANELAASKLREREGDMLKAGVSFRFFGELDHEKEFSEINTVLPECLSFLRSLQSE